MGVRRRALAGAILGAIIGLAAFGMHEAGWTTRWEQLLVDLRFLLRTTPPDSGDIVVIGIRRECTEDPGLVGPLPWPRRKFAQAVRTLDGLDASVIAFDVFFPPRPPPSPDGRDDDAELARAMREAGNVVLPLFDKYRGVGGGVVDFQENIPLLTREAVGLGHINVLPDPDGIVRRCPSRIGSLKRRYAELGVVAAARHLFQSGRTWQPARLPVARDGSMRINWRPPTVWRDGVNYFSFADLYHGRLTREQIEGRVVLIGQAAPGLPNADIIHSPFGARFGLFCQADIAESVVSGHFVSDWGPGTHLVVLVLLSCALGAAFFAFRIAPMIATAMSALVAVPVTAFVAFQFWGVLINVISLLAAIALLFGVSLACGLVRNASEARRWVEAVEVLRKTGFETGRALISRPQESAADPLGITGSLADALQVPDVTPPMVLSVMANALGAEHGLMRLQGRDGNVRWVATMEGGAEACLARELAQAVVALDDQRGPSLLIPRLAREPALRAFAEVADCAMTVQLKLGDETLATVALCGKRPTAISPHKRYDADDLRLALALAPQAALLLNHARLHRGLYTALRAAVATLGSAMSARDEYTSGHSSRVAHYSVFLARKMGLAEWCIEAVELGALLHDIGKIGMDEVILRGARKLSDEEWDLVQQHPKTGAGIFSHMAELTVLMPAIRHHHERYDGTGYPDGLAGADIPLLARIVGIADAFDAMTSRRPYRDRALTWEEAREEVLRCAGAQFDPALAAIFVEHATADLIDHARAASQEQAQSMLAPELAEPATESVTVAVT